MLTSDQPLVSDLVGGVHRWKADAAPRLFSSALWPRLRKGCWRRWRSWRNLRSGAVASDGDGRTIRALLQHNGRRRRRGIDVDRRRRWRNQCCTEHDSEHAPKGIAVIAAIIGMVSAIPIKRSIVSAVAVMDPVAAVPTTISDRHISLGICAAWKSDRQGDKDQGLSMESVARHHAPAFLLLKLAERSAAVSMSKGDRRNNPEIPSKRVMDCAGSVCFGRKAAIGRSVALRTPSADHRSVFRNRHQVAMRLRSLIAPPVTPKTKKMAIKSSAILGRRGNAGSTYQVTPFIWMGAGALLRWATTSAHCPRSCE